MLVLKQMMPQKKALILSFLETESLKVWHYQECTTLAHCRKTFFYPMPTYAFFWEQAWPPPDNAAPLNFLSPKSWVSELSSEVSFVSVLAMVLSEYWKRLEGNFWNGIIYKISQNNENYKNLFPPAFFNILKGIIASTETNNTSEQSSDTQLFGAGKFEGVACLGGRQASFQQKGYSIDFFTWAWRVFYLMPSMTSLEV